MKIMKLINMMGVKLSLVGYQEALKQGLMFIITLDCWEDKVMTIWLEVNDSLIID